MALVVHTSRDVVSLPDYGLTGEDGARFILVRITPFTIRVDIARNRLGSAGVKVLAAGLKERWHSWRDTDSQTSWGLDELNLAGVELGDEGFTALMDYVKLDQRLEKLMLQNNNMVLGDRALQSLLSALNDAASPLRILSLSNNPALSQTSISTLFSSLNAPGLTELHLSACNLGAATSPSIASFIRSPRSSRLHRLELNANALGPRAVQEIVAALDQGSYTLSGSLGLFANEPLAAVPTDDDGIAMQPTEIEPVEAEGGAESPETSKALIEAVEMVLPAALARNRTLTRRVRRAAMRTLAPARVILLARVPTPLETAREIMINLPSSTPSASATASPQARFDLLALPGEIIHLVIRHVRDAEAFSAAQWTRFLEFASNRETIGGGMDEFLERVGMERWEVGR